MIKKILTLIACLFFFTPTMAETYLRTSPENLESVVKKHFEALWAQTGVLDAYRNYLKQNSNQGITAKQLWVICKEGGLSLRNTEHKERCHKFANDLMATSGGYYNVCRSDKDKDGITKFCIDKVFDRDFGDSKVQVTPREAIYLSKAYARKQYKDEIDCLDLIETSDNDDFVSCKSIEKENTYYEFRFSDAKETEDTAVNHGVEAGICAIYDLAYVQSGSTAASQSMTATVTSWPSTCKTTTASICEEINKTAADFGYEISYDKNHGGCAFKSNWMSPEDIVNEYGKLIDNTIFSADSTAIQTYASVSLDETIKQYAEMSLAPTLVTDFKCNSSHRRLSRGMSNPDDVLTCYINEKRVDFIFDDITQSRRALFGKKKINAGKQGMSCIVSGGTYNGKACMHLNKEQCDQLRNKNQEECPSCKAAEWDDEDKMCVLPDAKAATQIQKASVITLIVAGAVVSVVLSPVTGGTSASVMAYVILGAELTGSAIELVSQIKINGIADEFFVQTNQCNQADCAEALVKSFIQRLANIQNDLKSQEIHAADKELARLIKLMPADSDFIADIIENGTTLEQREKGFFDAEGWEPEQIWRAVGIVLQLAGLVSGLVEKFTTKTVTQMDETSDALRRLTRSEAKRLDDAAAQLKIIDEKRKAAGLTKKQADDLWRRAKDINQSKNTLLIQLGYQEGDELLDLLKREAYWVDDLEKLNAHLDEIAKQQDNLFTVSKKGNKVLKQGKSPTDVDKLIKQSEEITAQIAQKTKDIEDLGKQIDNIWSARKIQNVTTTTTKLFDTGVTNTGMVGRAVTLEVKNQSRKQWDTNEKLIDASNTESNNELDLELYESITPVPAVTPDPDPAVALQPEVPEVVPEEPEVPVVALTPDSAVTSTPGSAVALTPGSAVASLPEVPVIDSTPDNRTITPYDVKKPKTGLIATAAVLGAVGTGFLVGGLLNRDKNDDTAQQNVITGSTVENEINTMLNNANSVIGVVGESQITLVPMATTVNTMSPIVNINNNAVVVVNYRGHKLPFYLGGVSWTPLLGIGQTGGWFNTYLTNPAPTYITQIQAMLNQKLAPTTVKKYIGVNSTGIQLPFAAPAAYSVINAEFTDGVVQTYTGALSGSDKTLHDNNYNKIKAIK